MYEFTKTTNGFNYVFEKRLEPHETIVIKMPPVSSNKRGINDIGWQSDGSVTLYGTLSRKPESGEALWQRIEENEDVNKTVYAIKVENAGAECWIAIRAIFY